MTTFEGLQDIAPMRACPFCGHDHWIGGAEVDSGGIWVRAGWPDDEGRIADSAGFWALCLICERCGFVRMHSLQQIGQHAVIE